MPVAADTTDSLLVEIRERYDFAVGEWAAIRTEAQTDMRYVAGDPWDPKDRKAREDLHRPCIATDELGQYFNQVTNGVRANPRAVKFTPNGNGADDTTAEYYANKMREIEYRSKAQIAYTTAFQNAVERSYGWCRVRTEWESPRAPYQDLWITDLPNPDLIVPDPTAQRPTSSDMQYCYVHEVWKQSEFKRKFPKAKLTDFSSFAADAPSFIKGEDVVVCEYWTIKTRPRDLFAVMQGAELVDTIFEDEIGDGLPPGFLVGRKLRRVDYPSVCLYLTNGIEVLEETPWHGKFIPIVSCFGKVIYVNETGGGAKRKILSMTRLARDPYMLYCYYRTQQAEMAGMIPKVPVMGYKGQFAGVEHDWQRAPHEPLAFLEANALTEATGAQVLPLPTRLEYNAGEHLQSLELCAEGARRAIQAAMGSNFLPTSAQRRNEKSGKALEKIEEVAQRGSFHFNDHYDDMIAHVGVIVEDLMDKTYDTKRTVGIRKADDTAEMVTINDPGNPEAISTKGDHLVTVSTGPSFDSERDAASDFVDTLASLPNVFPLIASEAVKLKNLGPIGDQIAEILEVLKPPEVRAMLEAKKQKGADPQQQAQALAALKGQLQQLEQVAQQMKQALDTEQAKQQALLQKAKDDNAVKLDIARMDNETRKEIELAKKRLELELQRDELRFKQQDREDTQAHELGMAAVEHEYTVAEAAQTHEHAIDQIAAQPAPVNGEGASA